MIRLLIVDDERTIRNGLVRHIDWQSLGVDMVTSAANAQAALHICEKIPPDIADPELKTFSMERNFHYILPVLKEAVALCDRPVSVLLSPWSPPQQWKTPPAQE